MIPIFDARIGSRAQEFVNRFRKRGQGVPEDVLRVVRGILADVRRRGDAAVFEYAQLFDGVSIDAASVRVTQREIDKAYNHEQAKELIGVIRRSAENIKAFHEKQLSKTWLDVTHEAMLGQLVRPLERVGIYVPGGRASYPSSVLMNAIPAKVAGVEEIVMVTPLRPEGIHPLTLVAAKEAGVDEIYKVGGAQAIAALAYGTNSIQSVDKIVGPGNIYVAVAKREVFGTVGIDMIAGPSEVLIVADNHASPWYCAADMLSQAEHDPLAAALLVTDSEALARAVQREVENQLAQLSRREIAAEAVEQHSAIVITRDIDDALEVANKLAPEHLELMTERPFELLGKVKNAGAVFLGEFSPEPLGDYFAGSNHVLPTDGTARYASPLGVDDFIKRTSVINYSRSALEAAKEDIVAFANAEGLGAHARSISIRFDKE